VKSRPRIVVVDLAMGNLRSVAKALERLGGAVTVSSRPGAMRRADAVVLPGDGAFAAAMARMRRDGWVSRLQGWVKERRPLLGVCLGLQVLFEESEEFGRHKGLGCFAGKIVPFAMKLTVPHMGWNRLIPTRTSWLTAGLPPRPYVYFVHSFYPKPDDRRLTAAVTDYGGRICAAIEAGPVAAMQFHPEKSQRPGLRLLRNFMASVRRHG